MEKRLILAVVLMMAVVFLVNILFPPAPAPQGPAPVDTAAAGRDTTPTTRPADTGTAEAERAARPEDGPRPSPGDTLRMPGLEAGGEPEAPGEGLGGDTVWVESPLYRLGFSTIGARLVSAELLDYESLSEGTRGQPVQLVVPEARDFLGHRWVVDQDTLDLRRVEYEVVGGEGRVVVGPGEVDRSLTLRYRHPRTSFGLELTYTFRPDRHVIDLEGRVVGVRPRGWWVLGLDSGLKSNEWDPEQDYENNLAFAARGPDGVESRKITDVEPEARGSLDGPFDWVAVRTKYFVTAVVRSDGQVGRVESPQFAGVITEGRPERFRAQGAASFPLPRDGGFSYRIYIGPQDYERLSAIGYDLDEVTPFGYKFLQPILRPLVGAITTLVVWSHRVLNLSYGWILILFGVAIRVILFPLYQKSMRQQMATMRVQPLMKEIQEKYKEQPQKLQQEMIKLYREHKINPLGGCLPMLLPFPILIALFFVFRDSIEFRGVPFLWLPDLSRPDPLYIIPIVMGLSVFLLQWISQRSMPQSNPQMKIMMWVMPIVLVIIFFNFASGLNLYYATMNLASLPQQLYLAKERQAMADQMPAPRKKSGTKT